MIDFAEMLEFVFRTGREVQAKYPNQSQLHPYIVVGLSVRDGGIAQFYLLIADLFLSRPVQDAWAMRP